MTTNQVAVINANSCSTSLAVALGKLSCSGGTGATNQSWGESVDWADILSVTSEAYTAGVYPVQRVNFASAGVVIPSNSAVSVKIAQTGGSPRFEHTMTIYTSSPAPSAAALAALFYAQYLSMSGVTLPFSMTYTAGRTYFDITGQFGDINLFLYDLAVTVNGVTASETSRAITSIAAGSDPLITTTTAHGLSAGDVVRLNIVGTGGDAYASLTGKTFIVASVPLATTLYVHLDGANINTTGITFSSGTLQDILVGNSIHMVQPVGTADMVLRDAPNAYVAGNTYQVVTVKRRKYISNPPFGHGAAKDVADKIYILTALSGAFDTGTVAAVFTTDPASAPANYLARL